MEDALVQNNTAQVFDHDTLVLILVLMEDALVHLLIFVAIGLGFACLNPCFNGRCTSTNFRL